MKTKDYKPTPKAQVRRRMTRIVVSDALGGGCQATVDDPRITGTPGKKIGWLVEDVSTNCGTRWHILLKFRTAWNNGADKEISIRRNNFKVINVSRKAALTLPGAPHAYDVYMVFSLLGKRLGKKVKLIDPELEIAP